MREILFRGKRVDNGEWIFGDLWHNNSETMIIDQPATIEYDVIPETVGQYTGLTDKNGKRIFERDIVKTQPFYDRPYSSKRKSKQFIGIVKYKTRIFNGNEYHSKQCYHGEWGLKFNEDFGEYNYYDWGKLWDCEVIGNEWDSPELLKGSEDDG